MSEREKRMSDHPELHKALRQEMPPLDWSAATDELLRQFPELEKYHRSAVAGSLVYAVAKGSDIDPDKLAISMNLDGVSG